MQRQAVCGQSLFCEICEKYEKCSPLFVRVCTKNGAYANASFSSISRKISKTSPVAVLRATSEIENQRKRVEFQDLDGFRFGNAESCLRKTKNQLFSTNSPGSAALTQASIGSFLAFGAVHMAAHLPPDLSAHIKVRTQQAARPGH